MTTKSKDDTNEKLLPAPETPPAEHAVPPSPSMIVGVGASAGGHEAFRELLEALPVPGGLAFVFIQHLEPSHQSMLPTLLSRATRILPRGGEGPGWGFSQPG